MKPGFNLSEGLQILKWAREQHIDLLHSHGYKFNILLGIVPRRWRRTPMVTTIHGYVHAPRFSKMWVYEVLDRFAIRFIDRVVIVSEAMENEFYGKSLSEGIHLIPNGIDIEATRQKAEKQPDPEVAGFLAGQKPVILGVGRLSPEKGFEVLIEAFYRFQKDFPDSRLLILGEGRERARLVDLAARYQLDDKLLLPGFIENVPSVMARCDCLVMPSYTEGMPITVLEAMAVGLPIVASGVGALPRVLDQGNAGLLVKPGRSEELLAAMRNCCKAEEETKDRVISAHKAVKREYSTRAMTNAYLELYRGMAV